MKKNLLAIITALTMLIPAASAFADEEVTYMPPENAEVQGDIMPISADIEIPVDTADEIEQKANYIANTATVTAVEDGVIKTTTNTEDSENPENELDFVTSEDTVVLESAKGEIKSVADVKAGDVVTVYTSIFEPMVMMLPPHYNANVVIINVMEIDSNRFFDVDTYYADADGNLVNMANTLQLNIDETTKIVDTKGNEVKADELADKDLAVIYMTATRSIPAQTTPIMIVVLGAKMPEVEPKPVDEPAIGAENSEPAPVDLSQVTSVKVGETAIANSYKNAVGTLMLPLRQIAEAKGMTVDWDDATKSVMLNGGMYSLQIGVNSYIKGRMTPVELSAAPEIVNDRTFVPAEYFTDVVESIFTVDSANTLIIDAE